MRTSEEVLEYWIDTVGEQGWYKSDPALDQDIRDRFLETWQAARDGGLMDWTIRPEGALAYLILTDQFPRNMFRDQAEAFATDALALTVAKKLIEVGWDMRIPEPERQFVYLPLMHSECLVDQDRCVRLICSRMPECGSQNMLHAKAHREVIRRFGRFPYRNPALARRTLQEEHDFLESGGYGATVRALQAGA